MILPIFLLSGCFRVPEMIKDIRELRQDHMFYIERSSWDREVAPSLGIPDDPFVLWSQL
jgi:hypothetical protein